MTQGDKGGNGPKRQPPSSVSLGVKGMPKGGQARNRWNQALGQHGPTTAICKSCHGLFLCCRPRPPGAVTPSMASSKMKMTKLEHSFDDQGS
jgi:hypothetical protein